MKRTTLSLSISSGAILAAVTLFGAASASAETRLSYGVGVSYCNSDFEACDEAAVVSLGIEQSLNEANSLEFAYLGGFMFGSGDYHSYALHLKHRLPTQNRGAWFIAAGPHYYTIEDSVAFAENPSRSGFGMSTKAGWQRYQPQGFGIDAGVFAKSLPGSDVTMGVAVNFSYAFNL